MSLKYANEKAVITDVKIFYHEPTSSLTSTPPPSATAPQALSYQYEIKYQHNGNTYITIYPNKNNMGLQRGDVIHIQFKKSDPYLIKTKTEFSDFYPLLFWFSIVFVLYSLFLWVCLQTESGRFYICYGGILSSIFGNKN